MCVEPRSGMPLGGSVAGRIPGRGMRVEPRGGMPRSGTGRIPGVSPLNPGTVVPGGVSFRAGGA
eukprot:1021072-Rhodomonas_salina.1